MTIARPPKSNSIRVHFRPRSGATSLSFVDAAPTHEDVSPGAPAYPLPIATPTLAASTSGPWARYSRQRRTRRGPPWPQDFWDNRRTGWWATPGTTPRAPVVSGDLPAPLDQPDSRLVLPTNCPP